MDEELSKCVRKILEGTASVESAQACLARHSNKDLKRQLSEPDVNPLMETYKARNQLQTTPLVEVSAPEAAAGWQRVMAATSPPKRPWPQFGQQLYSAWNEFCDLVTGSTVGKLGLVAALLVLVLIPVVHQYNAPQQPGYLGDKGPLAEAPATFQFSLVNPDGKLLRADRAITETDTLAFRVDAARKGFASIFIAQNQQLDAIISSQPLSKGVHDLSVGYTLSGNKGANTLILLFSDDPVVMRDPQRQRLLIQAVHNEVTSMTIEGNAIYIVSQQIEVH
jgi:hypothetical protein